MAGYIGQINVNNESYKIGSTLYGICNTAAEEPVKDLIIDGFSYTDGVTVHIKFINAYTDSNTIPKLKIKSSANDNSAIAYDITNQNGSKTWIAGSVISFTLIPTTNSYEWAINSFQIDTSNIVIDVSKIEGLSLGNITKEGKINNGQGNSLIITDNSVSIIEGPQFSSTADGSFLDNTGNWSSIQASSPLLITRTNASDSTIGSYTISLNTGYGDVQNPYGTKNKNLVLASSATVNGEAPTFRALVDADIPDTIARLASPTFTGTPLLTTTPSTGDNSHAIADTAFVINEINARLSSNDAMLFKGTIGTGGTVSTLPTNGYSAGWTYRVITAGTYAGQTCEVGDLIIAIKDGPATGSSVINNDWTVAQTNIDGSIYMGNNSLVSGQLLVADGTTGKITSSGYTIAAPAVGGLLYGDTTSSFNILAAGTNNQILTMSGGVPTWADAQHYATHLYITGVSGTTNTNAALSNGEVYLKLFDTSTLRESHKITGAGGATVTADANADITITSKKYKSAGSANAFTEFKLQYIVDDTTQTETMTADTAADIGYVEDGILYIKSIKYGTTSVSTGVSEDNT